MLPDRFVGGDSVKITDIKVNRLRAPGGPNAQSFAGATGRLIVRVFTDEGVVGIAEGSRNLNVFRAYVDDLIKPLIVGMDPVQPRRIWETLTLGTGLAGKISCFSQTPTKMACSTPSITQFSTELHSGISVSVAGESISTMRRDASNWWRISSICKT